MMGKIFFFLCAWGLACALQKGRFVGPLRKAGKEHQQIVNATNSFGFSLFKQLREQKNLVLCPYSMSLSLGMVYMGSGGVTEDELHRTLGYQDVNLRGEAVHTSFRDLSQFLLSAKGSHKLLLANAILVQRGYSLNDSFRSNLLVFYNASVDEVNFSEDGDKILEQLNDWVKQKTNRKIQSVAAEPFDPLTKAIVLNAVYFKGTWKTKFDERVTVPDTFYAGGVVPKTVPMMQMKQKLLYDISVRLDSYVLSLPYDGQALSMLLILPRERNGLPKLEKILTPLLVHEAANDLKEILVQVALPRFKMEVEQDMIPVLKSLGIYSLFSSAHANLTGIGQKGDLYVTQVISKTVIDVNEEGTEAAGFSGVSTGVRIGGPLHDMFRADHPFLFFIRDESTNTILFMGRVTDP